MYILSPRYRIVRSLCIFQSCLRLRRSGKFKLFRPRLHKQIKPPLIAQILDPYEVTPDEFAQIKHVLFAHVNAALETSVYGFRCSEIVKCWVGYTDPLAASFPVCLWLYYVTKLSYRSRNLVGMF